MTFYVKTYNKFGAKSTEYDGKIYHSKLEASYAADLDLMLKAKQIKAWERQVPLRLDVNGYHICNYIVDFKVYHHDGTIEYIETKGFETDTFRLKRKLLEALFEEEIKKGEIKYTIIKQGNSWIKNQFKRTKTLQI